MKRILRLALPAIVLLVIGGTTLWCWLAPKKPALGPGAACPPVRTALAMVALVENPTAKTFAALGSGVGVFTNFFVHAGLVAETNDAARVDLVFVSGDVSKGMLAHAWKRCATNGLLAIHYDVRKLTFGAFGGQLAVLPEEDWRLWFPGRSDALVTVRPSIGESKCGQNVRIYRSSRLADMLNLFAQEGLFDDLVHAGIDSLQVLLASYAGSRAEALPVFGFAQGEVVPECFVTKEISPMDWIDCSGVDADIREALSTEIRSMMLIRRFVLKGDMLSRGGDMNGAMAEWTKAIKRNPNDTLILERICLLDVNAETFLKVGNFPLAAQCLETMVCLRPRDVQTMRRLARVLQQLGKKEMAGTVLDRADAISKAELKARRAGK